jgi:hypothetical protein
MGEGGLGLDKLLDCGCGCAGLRKSDIVKFKYAFYTGIIFCIISNPEMYKITNHLFGSWISTSGGCPSSLGVLVHSAIFILVVYILMQIRT